MIRPIEPSGEEPIEAAVRQLLWRLRARLVTPPDDERSVADLDRLLAAAREHAQVAPEPELRAGDSIRHLRFGTVGRVVAATVLVVVVGVGVASIRNGAGALDALPGRTSGTPSIAGPSETAEPRI